MKKGDKYLCYFGEYHENLNVLKGEKLILTFDYFSDNGTFFESSGHCLEKSVGDYWIKLSPAIRIMFDI